MNTFPSLSRSPDIQGFFRRRPPEAVGAPFFASGYPCMNKLFTFNPVTWGGTLSSVGQTDMEALDAFYVDNCDVPFYWYNKQDDTIYEVVFAKPPDIQIQGNDDKELWQIGLELRQAADTTLPGEYVTRRFYGGDAMIDMIDLAAGADISDYPVFVAVDAIRITKCRLLTKGTPSGIDNSNTAVLTLTVNGNTLLTKTYNAGTQPPTRDEEDLTDNLVADYLDLDEGDVVKLSLTQGATANMPAFLIAFGSYLR